MSLFKRTKNYTTREYNYSQGKYENNPYTKQVLRVWTWLLPVVLVVGMATTGVVEGIMWGNITWTEYHCFTVNYVDMRGGYAPAPAVYTSIGTIDSYENGQVYMGDIGKWKVGDSYCGPIQYGNGQATPIVFFGPRVNTSHAVPNDPFAPSTIGDAP